MVLITLVHTGTSGQSKNGQVSKKIFPVRGCNLPLDWNKKFKSCIDYNIGLCKILASLQCQGRGHQDVGKFKCSWMANSCQLSKVMYAEMWKASEDQEFERASKYRNAIESLEATALKQRISFPSQMRDKDVVTIAREGGIAAAIVFQVREGNVVGREKYILEGVNEKTDDKEVVSSFIKQHYSQRETNLQHLPQEIVYPAIFLTWRKFNG